MPQLKLVFIVIILFIVPPTSSAKKRCKPLLIKLHNIQAMQRNSYSSKRGVSLRAKEDKARDTWWQCEQGRGKNKKSNNKNKKKRYKKKISYTEQAKTMKIKKIKAGTPFKTSHAIVIKSKYQGDKKRAWLVFYQQPMACQRPKNLQEFVFCSKNKKTQRKLFEKQHVHRVD